MPAPTIFSYTLVDENGSKSTSRLYVAYDAATETVASLQGAAAAFGGLIDAVTSAKIASFEISVPFLPDPGWKAAALADSNIEDTLLENFVAADTPYPQEFIVPAVRGSLIGVDGKPILTGGGAIALLNAAIVGGSGAVFPNDKYLNDLTALLNAARTVRRNRGSLAKTRVTP